MKNKEFKLSFGKVTLKCPYVYDFPDQRRGDFLCEESSVLQALLMVQCMTDYYLMLHSTNEKLIRDWYLLRCCMCIKAVIDFVNLCHMIFIQESTSIASLPELERQQSEDTRVSGRFCLAVESDSTIPLTSLVNVSICMSRCTVYKHSLSYPSRILFACS